MIISHSRKFILFTDPLGAGEQVQSLLAPFGDAEIGATPRNRECNPFFHGMTPLEAEWAFDAAGYAFHTYLRLSMIVSPRPTLFGSSAILRESARHLSHIGYVQHMRTGLALVIATARSGDSGGLGPVRLGSVAASITLYAPKKSRKISCRFLARLESPPR